MHGLGADAEYTWTAAASSSTNSQDGHRTHLLRLIKADFPTARILAFAYNSDWLIDAPVKSAQQIGDRLLDKLAADRSKRPVGLYETTKYAPDQTRLTEILVYPYRLYRP